METNSRCGLQVILNQNQGDLYGFEAQVGKETLTFGHDLTIRSWYRKDDADVSF